MTADAAFGQGRGRPGSLRRDPGPVRAGRRAGARDRLPARRRAETPTTPASLVHRFRGSAAAREALEGGLAVLEPHPRRRARRNARPAAQRPGQRLAAVPDPGVPPVGPQRLLPVGRRLRLPRPVAGRDGAGPLPSRACCASICCGARPTSSARATSSTGGIPPRAAACARTAPTITSGCPSRPAAMCSPPATPACSTSTSTFSTAAPCGRGGGLLLRSARPLGRNGHPLRALRARHPERPARSASTACR